MAAAPRTGADAGALLAMNANRVRWKIASFQAGIGIERRTTNRTPIIARRRLLALVNPPNTQPSRPERQLLQPDYARWSTPGRVRRTPPEGPMTYRHTVE